MAAMMNLYRELVVTLQPQWQFLILISMQLVNLCNVVYVVYIDLCKEKLSLLLCLLFSVFFFLFIYTCITISTVLWNYNIGLNSSNLVEFPRTFFFQIWGKSSRNRFWICIFFTHYAIKQWKKPFFIKKSPKNLTISIKIYKTFFHSKKC
jgi:hypothetical protein